MTFTPEQIAKAARFNVLGGQMPTTEVMEEQDSILASLKAELGKKRAEALVDSEPEQDSLYREPARKQSPNSEKTAPETVSLHREKSAPETAFVPVRKEEWIESEEYPGIWTNASGEIMDGATKKVRTVTTAFNPKTRRYSSRVWLNGEYKAVWWQQLMIERNRLRPKKGGA